MVLDIKQLCYRTTKYNIINKITLFFSTSFSFTSIYCVLVSFGVVNMFLNIDNKSGLLSVKEALTDSNFDVDSTQCIVDALEICLTCNNSTFNHQHFLQTDGATQGPHMSYSYADIAMAKYYSL